MITGNVDGAFSIDRALGIIIVSRPLDAYVQREYTLTVCATDAGIPPLYSTATVRIGLTMSNDELPKFDQVEYVAEVVENRPIGTYVAMLRSQGRSSVVYRITGGNDAGHFTVDPSSGLLFIVYISQFIFC